MGESSTRKGVETSKRMRFLCKGFTIHCVSVVSYCTNDRHHVYAHMRRAFATLWIGSESGDVMTRG